MLLRSLGMLLGGTVLLGAAEPASTCIFAPQRLHRVDTSLQRNDHDAPAQPVLVEVEAFRRNGMTCTRESCVQNSCGDTGTVRIELAPSADDATPPEQLGYRLILLRGELPSSLSASIGVTLAAGHPLFLRPGFDELPALDVTLAAVAVDAAGNESEPTAPFDVRFDGCTLAAVGDRCEDELEPDTDLSAVFEAQLSGEPERAAAGPDASAGCGLSSHASSRGAFWSALLGVVLGAGLARRRSHKRPTGYPQPCG